MDDLDGSEPHCDVADLQTVEHRLSSEAAIRRWKRRAAAGRGLHGECVWALYACALVDAVASEQQAVTRGQPPHLVFLDRKRP